MNGLGDSGQHFDMKTKGQMVAALRKRAGKDLSMIVDSDLTEEEFEMIHETRLAHGLSVTTITMQLVDGYSGNNFYTLQVHQVPASGERVSFVDGEGRYIGGIVADVHWVYNQKPFEANEVAMVVLTHLTGNLDKETR